MKNKKEYISPELTVVEFKTERGYASSTLNLKLISAIIGINNFQQEIWTIDDNTFGSNGGIDPWTW
jgi:hypothetical protein